MRLRLFSLTELASISRFSTDCLNALVVVHCRVYFFTRIIGRYRFEISISESPLARASRKRSLCCLALPTPNPIMGLPSFYLIVFTATALALPQAPTPTGSGKVIQPTGAPQVSSLSDPSVPASVTFEGPYTLPHKPTECTASSLPFQTSMWVHGNQLTVEDAGAGWTSKDPADWTFSTNTSGIVFGNPYFPAGGGCASGRSCPTIAKRTQPNSFTITTSSSGKEA